MAMEQARRLSNDGQRVALICYSHGLASTGASPKTWSRRQQPGYVGEFHTPSASNGAHRTAHLNPSGTQPRHSSSSTNCLP